MAIYKRYNTRKKKLSKKIIIPLFCILVAFVLTVIFGSYLGKKARGTEPQYTGEVFSDSESVGLRPISEKSLHGIYVDADELDSFTSESEDEWASTWIYRDGKAMFATELDAKLGKETKKLPTLEAFDIEHGTIGLFTVTCLYADEAVRGIVTEYEKSLIAEFMASGLDEVVLVFDTVSEDNYRSVLDFAGGISGAKVVCVPYEMLESQEFFSAAAQKGINIALMASGVDASRLERDIDTYAFYFTKYNLRILLSGDDGELADVLNANTLLNYQFYSAKK